MPGKFGTKKSQKNSEKLQQLSKLKDKSLRMISFLAPRRPLITSIKMKIYSNEEISYYFKIVLLIKDYFDSELPCTFNRYFNKTKMTNTFWGKFYFCQQSELNLLWQRTKKASLSSTKPGTTYETHLISISWKFQERRLRN